MKIKLLICAAMGAVALAFAAKDPVLMTINGKEIHLSEFEYLYKKNSQQQIQKETIEQYVDRFVTYKLKVTDAEAEKIDTTRAFKAEFEGYKNDLVKPFLVDTTVTYRLVNEAYERMKYNVDVDHIMLPLGDNKLQNDSIIARLDSIKNRIENGEDFSELAMKYSIDPSKKRNKGHYGYIASGMFPYTWEVTAFSTPIGQISKPFRTDFGNHLIRVNNKREDPGTVECEHILVLFPRDATDSVKAVCKQRIDSIYTAIKNGANFEELAKTKSDDHRSSAQGGLLPRFGVNRMMPEFEQVAFSLNDGEISEPFATPYGYHIVKKLHHYPVPTLEEARQTIEQAISRDERSQMPRDAKIEQLMKQYHYAENANFKTYLEKKLAAHGQYDSTFVAGTIASSNEPIFTYSNISVPASVLAQSLNPKAKLTNDAAVGYITSMITPYAKNEIMRHYVDNIIDENADYRNLINEYRDGMLLFEVSNRKVWEGASKDTVGLKNYFEANRAKYNWASPHFKGIILSAKNDSVMNEVIKAIPTFGADTLTTALHEKFSNGIKMERMLFAQGENETADKVVFGSTQKVVETGNKKYPLSMVLEGGVIDQPENVWDVKGQVTSDYQDLLEQKWIKELKVKYPVKINKKVLKSVK